MCRISAFEVVSFVCIAYYIFGGLPRGQGKQACNEHAGGEAAIMGCIPLRDRLEKKPQ